MRSGLPALLGAGHTWRAAVGMARARRPSGSRGSGRKSPGAKTPGKIRLRVEQADGVNGGAPAERPAMKKQANLHRGDDKLRRMYTYGERLRWAMAHAVPPVSGRALAKRIGMRHQSIYYLLDPSRNAQGSRHTPALARALGVSADWLASGAGQPYRNGKPQLDLRHAVASSLETARQLVQQLEQLARALDGKS